MKNWKPWVFENSKLPIWLSKIAPINVWAFSFAFWVCCRGKISDRTRQHETIHYQQQLELLMVFQWILYGLFHLIGLIKYRDGTMAYHENPFEREAYNHDEEEFYLENRKRFSWVKYICTSKK